MINKIVLTKNGNICRILDSYMSNEFTNYLVIDCKKEKIFNILPHDIVDIMEYDENKKEYISVSSEIVKIGL